MPDKQIGVRLSAETIDKLTEQSYTSGLTVTELVRLAVQKYLNSIPGEGSDRLANLEYRVSQLEQLIDVALPAHTVAADTQIKQKDEQDLIEIPSQLSPDSKPNDENQSQSRVATGINPKNNGDWLDFGELRSRLGLPAKSSQANKIRQRKYLADPVASLRAIGLDYDPASSKFKIIDRQLLDRSI